jgi:hypothetical protein
VQVERDVAVSHLDHCHGLLALAKRVSREHRHCARPSSTSEAAESPGEAERLLAVAIVQVGIAIVEEQKTSLSVTTASVERMTNFEIGYTHDPNRTEAAFGPIQAHGRPVLSAPGDARPVPVTRVRSD